MIFGILFVSYLIGSIPFALLIGKLCYKADIREHGSGNLGATNSLRVLGKKAGAFVLFGDAAKGSVAVAIPMLLQSDVDPLYAGFAAILGHCFPVFAGFRGGKAVATTAGVLIILNPTLFLAGFAAFFGMMAATKYVAAGSISIYPALALTSFYEGNTQYALMFALFSVMMIYLHRTNLKNFIQGKEPKINDSELKKDRINPN